MKWKLRTAWKIYAWAGLSLVGAMLCMALPAAAVGYVQTNLVSDIPGLANNTDPNLKNPWGISYSATSPFWVSDNATGLATLYNTAGTPQALVVTIPPFGSATPTGQVFNVTTSFNGDRFIFASEDGTISGWRGALGTTAETLVLASDAVYKGLALGTIGTNSYLYAANFHSGAIDVIKGNAGAPDLSGFTDPGLPSGYAPFNVQNIGSSVLVTYAAVDPMNPGDELHGPGLGFLSEFDLNGNFMRRVVSNGGPLNAPWGLAIAPANFGEFSNDLLVGNFGDGKINAFDPATGAFLGALRDKNGDPIVIDGLWGLIFGNGGNGGDLDKLYFTAGLNDEANGLFGSLAVPLPPTFILLGSGLAGLLTFAGARRRRV